MSSTGESELVCLERLLLEANNQAAEEQKRAQEADQRAKEERTHAQEANEQAEDERKRAGKAEQRMDKEQKHANEEQTKTRCTTLEEYILTCYMLLSKPLRIQTDKSLSAQGSITSPKNKPCSTLLTSWKDFSIGQLKQFERISKYIPKGARFFGSVQYLTEHGQDLCDRRFGSEKEGVKKAQKAFRLGDGIAFENHANTLADTNEEVQQSLRNLRLSSHINLNKQNLIGVGVFAQVHRLDRKRVRKVPAPDPDNLNLAMKSIQREGQIYDYLGDHPRIIKCLYIGDDFVDLEFAPHGHIESYLKCFPDASDKRRIQFAQDVIEAVVFIHSKGIIHSDLAARQFLLDSSFHAKLSDFGFSSFSDGGVLGFENPSHHLPRDVDSKPSTVQSDLFAVGSTLYEIMAGEKPYKGESDDTITQLYTNRRFPDTASILCGQIISGCWYCHFESAAEVQKQFLIGSHISEN